MRKFFTALVVIPLGLIFIVFAVANRHFVTVSFDPFNSTDPAIAVSMPLGRGGGFPGRSAAASGAVPVLILWGHRARQAGRDVVEPAPSACSNLPWRL